PPERGSKTLSLTLMSSDRNIRAHLSIAPYVGVLAAHMKHLARAPAAAGSARRWRLPAASTALGPRSRHHRATAPTRLSASGRPPRGRVARRPSARHRFG